MKDRKRLISGILQVLDAIDKARTLEPIQSTLVRLDVQDLTSAAISEKELRKILNKVSYDLELNLSWLIGEEGQETILIKIPMSSKFENYYKQMQNTKSASSRKKSTSNVSSINNQRGLFNLNLSHFGNDEQEAPWQDFLKSDKVGAGLLTIGIGIIAYILRHNNLLEVLNHYKIYLSVSNW